VLREKTERREMGTEGILRLVGRDYSNVLSSVTDALNSKCASTERPSSTIFGDGSSAEKIVEILMKYPDIY
jgi:UDP-N-acetylglucosamine 2-epimerase